VAYCSIFKVVRITVYDSIRLENILVVQTHVENKVATQITPQIEYFSVKEFSVSAMMTNLDCIQKGSP
jgi:hypothetical protein